MALLSDDVAREVREALEELTRPVRLAVFSQALADPATEQVRRLVEEVCELSPNLTTESYNFVLDREKVEALGIARIPAVAVLGETEDYGVRFYGMPSGYEFGTLLDAVLDVGRGDSELAPETREALAALPKPVHIQVFSTPT